MDIIEQIKPKYITLSTNHITLYKISIDEIMKHQNQKSIQKTSHVTNTTETKHIGFLPDNTLQIQNPRSTHLIISPFVSDLWWEAHKEPSLMGFLFVVLYLDFQDDFLRVSNCHNVLSR